MARAPKMMRKRRYDDGGIVEKTFSDDESVKSRFGDDMLDKARAYTSLAREPLSGGKSAARAKPKAASASQAKAKPASLPDDDSSDEVQSSRLGRAERVETRSEKRFPPGPPPKSDEPAPRKGTLEDPEYRKKLEKDQALESVSPESYMIGGGALKGLNAAAKAVAGRAIKQATSIMEAAGKRAATDRARAQASSAAESAGARVATNRARVQASEAMGAAGQRAATDRARKQELSEMRERAQDAAKRKADADDTARVARRAPRDADESRMAGEGGPNFRKGGSVRGCGIARKGFTKGTMR